jgi:hypothetical protein
MTKLIAFFCLTLFGATSVTSIASERLPPQQEIVAKLYTAYAWQPLWRSLDVRTSINHENLNTLKKYFTPELVSLLNADKKCAELDSMRSCNIDFDMLFTSQDPHVFAISVGRGKSDEQVVVTFNDEYPFTNYKAPHKYSVICVVAKTKAGWRISDILYGEGSSLKSKLRRPVVPDLLR